MLLTPKRIAVLFHKNERDRDMSNYIVDYLANCWRADGHEVVYLFGTKLYVPADIVLVHVNLSVVLDKYIEFASQYPIVLNGRICDIRKRAISNNIISSPDQWGGPVIVKSDLNFAGLPERILDQSWIEQHSQLVRRLYRGISRMLGNELLFDGAMDYKIFEHSSEVPLKWFNDRYLVVEKFLPEVEDGVYHTRIYQFLGDSSSCTRVASSNPIVKAGEGNLSTTIEPDPDVVTWRKQFGLDYGKLDYVIHDEKAVLLDVNKTTGASISIDRPGLAELRQKQARGIYCYFDSGLQKTTTTSS